VNLLISSFLKFVRVLRLYENMTEAVMDFTQCSHLCETSSQACLRAT